MKKNINVKKKSRIILVLMLMILAALAVLCYLLFLTPKVFFKENPAVLEIHDTYEPTQFVSKLRRLDWKDVKVKGTINTNKLGSYEITYQAKGFSYILPCLVKDTKKPKVVTQDQTIRINTAPKPEQFIKEIKDATKTTITFKNKYSFDKLGDQKIILIVRDEGGNTREVSAIAHVVQDDEPPVIHVHDFEVIQGGSIDLKSGIYATDNQDDHIEIDVDATGFDIESAGTYTITYRASDKAGNKAEASAIVRVYMANEYGKVIYLTIDDGPSANTIKILDILDRYQVKATFFVTAQFPNYASYIHEAYIRGHSIGLHTYSHNYALLYANEQAYFQDLEAVQSLVKQQTGKETRIIRFPGGSSNTISSNYNTGIMTRLSREVTKRGYQYYDWNGESGDGNSNLSTSTLIETAKTYSNRTPLYFLMHDHAGSNASVEALPEILEYYIQQGYSFQVLTPAVPSYHHHINN